MKHQGLGAHRAFLWEPTYGQRGRNRRNVAFVDNTFFTGAIAAGELAVMMNDK